MIKRIFILPIIVLSCCGCVSSDKKVSTDKNQPLTVDTIIKFFPEKYTEDIKDTLVDSVRDLRVTIKESTRMDKFVTQDFKLDSLHFQKLNYRDQTFEFKISERKTVIFDKTITKEKLTQIKDKDFLSKAIMYNAWFDTYDKRKKEVRMIFNIIVPDTDWGCFFILTVDKIREKPNRRTC